ncbi:hypothetical protein DICPUDRAFT_149899 [Dictyostelium purpureum]|uniref:J domain-containing protein n=1 Tax=Dictyostelium purpureum TaxID=5786 RepID=F0ZEY3_DICPU|nr:uncharacterized protein DICPUDRAFT_149899 [Dictyostelium purpureum]EGC37486.1 hypothetical protein DICPUDRAFT_149899 [Dictyostelium purpureum]|eukprot:XP_003285960.1 hypothetical protein DICPUDRAFT_149899 [Dictyostelium purpureum]
MTNLYRVLELDTKNRQNITKAQIREAYVNLALRHSDKGGDNTAFQEISNAYRVLYDENKRKQYDADNDTQDRQIIIISQLISTIVKMEPEFLKKIAFIGGGCSLVLGFVSLLAEDDFTLGARLGLAVSIENFKYEILSLVDKNHRRDVALYLDQIIENIKSQ